MTAGIATIQSLGYVTLLMSIPNAVADPGPVFVIRSVLLLTGSAVVVSLLVEQLVRRPPSGSADTNREPEPVFAPLGTTR
jgi:hypothetical protein